MRKFLAGLILGAVLIAGGSAIAGSKPPYGSGQVQRCSKALGDVDPVLVRVCVERNWPTDPYPR